MTRITLGQYYPVSSPLHSLDGRIRIICTLIFMVTSFLCDSYLSFALMLFFSLALVFMSRVPLGIILKSIKAVIVILLISFIMNIFFYTGDETPLFSFWIFSVCKSGIIRAFLMSFRIVVLVVISCLMFSYTATPIDITHSIEGLFAPFKFMRTPVHYFSMMMFIALRFIPTLSDDTDKIMTAQKSRGADFSEGSVGARVKSLTTILIPLFVSSFRRADELAVAMECRGYHGGEGRTRLSEPHIHPSDIVMLVLFAAFCAGVVLLNIYTPWRLP